MRHVADLWALKLFPTRTHAYLRGNQQMRPPGTWPSGRNKDIPLDSTATGDREFGGQTPSQPDYRHQNFSSIVNGIAVCLLSLYISCQLAHEPNY